MFNKVPQGFLALILFLIPALVCADNLLDVFNLALENDPALKAAQAQRQATQESHPQTFAKLFPTISVEGHAGKRSQDLKEALAANQSDLGTSVYNEIFVTLSLTQPLFNLSNFRNRKVSEVKLVKAELNYRIAQEKLLFRVAQTYFNTLSSIDKLNFARAEKNAIANQLQQTKQRFDLGLTAVTDVHEAQARHDFALANEIKAESELANQREALRGITGKLHDNLMMIKPDTPLIPPTPANMNDWTEAAKGQNLHIAAKKMEADLIIQKLNVIRAEHYPTLDFNASYGYNDYGGAYLQKSLDAIVSLNFKMNIFEGNIVASRIREQQFLLEKTIQEIEIKQREILQQTRSAYLGVLAGMSYVKALNQALKSSEQAIRAISAGFEVGTRTAIELLDAQRELFRSQRDYSSSRYDYILNMLRLKIAVGLLSIDDLEQINNWLY